MTQVAYDEGMPGWMTRLLPWRETPPPRDPRPTLVAYGAPLLVPCRKEMSPADALVSSLSMLDEDPRLLYVLPLVLVRSKPEFRPAELRRKARRWGVQAELGAVLELAADVSSDPDFQRWAQGLRVRDGEPRYLTSSSSQIVRRALEERTPPLLAKWGFRVDMSMASAHQFFRKHLASPV